MIAALFVEPNGVYAGLEGVDLWDEERDARQYAGPYPVVAHPPCARWCMLAPFVQARYGHKIGDDGGCFVSALASVKVYGGVLEHPAYSYAWKHHSLTRPKRGVWTRSLLDEGWVTEVSQAAYGHPARKRTWLYYVGDSPPADMDWSEPAFTKKMVSDLGPGGSRKRGEEWEPGVQYAEASATPPAFRDVLLELARNSRSREEVAA